MVANDAENNFLKNHTTIKIFVVKILVKFKQTKGVHR